MGIRRNLLRLLAILFAFAMVAAACGSSDDDDSSSSSSESASATAEDHSDDDDHDHEEEETGGGLSQDAVEKAVSGDDEAEQEVDEDAPTFDTSTIEGLEASWTYNREKLVAMITEKMEAGEWGVGDDGILRGPTGFEIDLNECPADWSDTGGVTADSVRIGHTTAQSGNLAAYGNIAVGWDSYNNYVNENGGIGGRDIELIVKDDAYVAAQTIEFIDELIESENVFMIVTLGSPNTLAVYDTLNSECVPQPFVQTGHPAWGDPEIHPWTSGMIMSYSTEAVLWGTWIKNNLADQLPVKVAGLVMDNDFGLAYELGFEAYAEDNPDIVAEYLPVRHDPAAPTVTNEVTTIAAFDPDVFISMTAGNPCLLAIQEVEASGLLDSVSAAFTPSVCVGIAAYMTPAGMAADGWWIAGGGWKDSQDANYTDDPYMKFINETLESDGLDQTVSLYGVGFGDYGWSYNEVLRVAAELPGGLSRTNFILALRTFSGKHPKLLDGIEFGAWGASDGYFVEGSDFSQFDATNQSWVQVGDLVDANGLSPNCRWDKDNGGCR
ncbi:MAG: ABC transporter substrate-binding protein [Acidimicrobiales bacterium]|nr:ABC transporter substrate-binding protein [Acidimicrobiales bacterium]